MNVNKNQIVNGVVRYAKTEIVNNITDKPVKMMFAAAIKTLEIMPNLADKIFNNPMVAVILQENNGEYDLEAAFKILSETMDEYGDFPFVVPIIKTPLIFTRNDIQKLKEHIERS